ncbi:MAG: pantoate--beta-alanine ligase [Blastocatellia bacterium]
MASRRGVDPDGREFMEIITKVARMQFVAEKLCAERRSIGFVQTMGALHEGHLTRVREARRMCDVVVVSIFVNPSPDVSGQELTDHPRDLARDADLLTPIGVDYVFAPSIDDIFPSGFASLVRVTGLSDRLEGVGSPDHFDGVTTAMTILFNVIKPKFAFLGQRDAQQTIVIKRLVRDLHLPVEVVVVPVVREPDGLACSSRNRALTSGERQSALAISRSLRLAEELYDGGERHAQKIIRQMRKELDGESGLKLEYLAVTDLEQLEPVDDLNDHRRVLVSLAAYVGQNRLIDNTILSDDRQRSKSRVTLW